jgi:hypothetical protein
MIMRKAGSPPAFLVGTLVAGMSTRDIIAGFPGGLFLTPSQGRDHPPRLASGATLSTVARVHS